jgi:hypothetical protein
MPVTFYGKWSFEVVGNVGEFPQRAIIAGSVASDGIYSGAIGTKIASIDAPSWTLTLQRSEDGGATWKENIENPLPIVTLQEGWTVNVYGDDAVVPPQFADVTVKLVYLNPVVNPPPLIPGYSFTLPPQNFRPPSPGQPVPICECESCRPKACTCRKVRTPIRPVPVIVATPVAVTPPSPPSPPPPP